jgi:hypothetical protein
MPIIALDGPIGAGKSEALEGLHRMGFDVLFEPIDQWTPLLDRLYARAPGASFELQRRVVQARPWGRLLRSAGARSHRHRLRREPRTARSTQPWSAWRARSA